MTVMLSQRYRRGEMHEFQAAENGFIYLVSAGAIFALDDVTRTVLDLIEQGNAEKVARAMHKHLIDVESYLALEEERKMILDLHEVFSS